MAESTSLARSSQQLAAHALQHIIASAWTRESAAEIRYLNNLIAHPQLGAILAEYDSVLAKGTLSIDPVAANAVGAGDTVLAALEDGIVPNVPREEVAELRDILGSIPFQVLSLHARMLACMVSHHRQQIPACRRCAPCSPKLTLP